ncbi:hybrid sensor histidine kinase/response regulator [Arcobacter sp. CECT 8983]|uniref:sensor histidine kinase n=1 Tax=Arcobacter sp. CECT 8983 TaxID=2044508 RepID=UPI00100AB745|nr:response regulator [Arcobacter sp. CECT 8983]RXJ91180.1 hybrid sensor histidine kinase/response regulator [Arcobacter sp. CECT 8983]
MENRFSVLILDDVQDNIYSLELLIEDLDINIHSALNANAAINILMQENIDLILCDIQMPDIDGFQFVEYIKRIDKLKDIPVIFITGIYDKDLYQKKGYDLGAIEYISKPIDDVLLTSKLKSYIDLFNKNKQIRTSLEKANKLAVHNTKMASIGEMIGVISHQLKQPLNVLSIYCDDIKFAYQYNELNDEMVDEFSQNTKKQIHYMRDTIDGFLSFFNPDKNKNKFEIKKVIESTQELLGSQIKKANVALETQMLSNYTLSGIDMELSQVLINLITNSIQAFEERGINDRKIELITFSKDEKNYLIVSDNAGGIEEENLEKIFDPYYTTKEEGTGVGLYMVKLVIKNSYNGNLKIENFQDGVRFIMQF